MWASGKTLKNKQKHYQFHQDDLADEIDRFVTETEIFKINQKCNVPIGFCQIGSTLHTFVYKEILIF